MSRVWSHMHDEAAALSTRGENRQVDAGHYIWATKPQAVIEAVNEVVAAVRAITLASIPRALNRAADAGAGRRLNVQGKSCVATALARRCACAAADQAPRPITTLQTPRAADGHRQPGGRLDQRRDDPARAQSAIGEDPGAHRAPR